MDIRPETFEEKLVWYSIVGTYGFYLLGALYLLAPVLAWFLAVRFLRQRHHARINGDLAVPVIPVAVWIWAGAMLAMELSLVAAHLDFELGLRSAIKSSVGWAKGWALFPLFMIIGCMSIRAELLYRAACVLSVQTLFLFPLLILTFLLHLPADLYVSPISAIGGPGPEFFTVSLYGINPDNGLPRWRLFTPWAPAIGFVANIYFFLALQEKDRLWKIGGLVGCVVMVLMSGSRLGLVSIPVVLLLNLALTRLTHPVLYYVSAAISVLMGFFWQSVQEGLDAVVAMFVGARKESSRVRAILGRIAVDRWGSEAPLWGHGIVEPGPHLVEHMPIGSHHTWYGLLFVKGMVGFVALALAMFWSFVTLLFAVVRNESAKVGLNILFVIFLYSFGENLEILAYLIWPGLVLMGIAFREAAMPIVNSALTHTNILSQSGTAA